MNIPVPPKNIIPREPTFWEGEWDTAKTFGPWALLGYAMCGGGDKKLKADEWLAKELKKQGK